MENSDQLKLARRNYMRDWREKNREHVRKYDRRYREEHQDVIAAAQARFWKKKCAEMCEEFN